MKRVAGHVIFFTINLRREAYFVKWEGKSF